MKLEMKQGLQSLTGVILCLIFVLRFTDIDGSLRCHHEQLALGACRFGGRL